MNLLFRDGNLRQLLHETAICVLSCRSSLLVSLASDRFEGGLRVGQSQKNENDLRSTLPLGWNRVSVLELSFVRPQIAPIFPRNETLIRRREFVSALLCKMALFDCGWKIPRFFFSFLCACVNKIWVSKDWPIDHLAVVPLITLELPIYNISIRDVKNEKNRKAVW